MWIYGPSTEEKSKRLHSFDKHLARLLRFKKLTPHSKAKKYFFQSMPCRYSKLESQGA